MYRILNEGTAITIKIKHGISVHKTSTATLCVLLDGLGFAEALNLMRLIAYTILSLLAYGQLAAEQPKDWQLGFQKSASKSMSDIVLFHDYMLLPIITAITVFVLFLVIYACIKFRATKNKIASQTSHNTTIEIVWTLVPCLILIIMAVPSFKVLYSQDKVPPADVTVKAIGYQWYWGYEYPDENIIFESYMVEDKDLRPDQPLSLIHISEPTRRM